MLKNEITDLLNHWNGQAVPLAREVRALYSAAEESGNYTKADERSADLGEVYGVFATGAVDLLKRTLPYLEVVEQIAVVQTEDEIAAQAIDDDDYEHSLREQARLESPDVLDAFIADARKALS